eukprot:jgi/Picsp_1/17/NSC_00017-R1_hypothetical protein CHLNCDRAFT_133827 [Chlorella variabilis]
MAGLTIFSGRTHFNCFTYFASQSGLNGESSRYRTRHRARLVQAFGANPYEPLERAIQIANRIISIGEKAQWNEKNDSMNSGMKGNETLGAQASAERWVQFGAVRSARVPIQLIGGVLPDTTKKEHPDKGDATLMLLEEYLSLPTSEYSLLDPKWVERKSQDEVDIEVQGHFAALGADATKGDIFVIRIPLRDIVGVNMTPSLSVLSQPCPGGTGTVTLIGSKASLGSPGLDESFRLNVVAKLRSRHRKNRLPKMPDHIPGRPVSRLQKWAANARQKVSEETDQDDKEDLFNVENIDDINQSAPFPLERIYVSKDTIEEEEEPRIIGVASEFEASEHLASAEKGQEAFGDSGVFLECRVNVSIAFRVPKALRVIPNPLLGYAGSLITRVVLNGAVPNFTELLGKDFREWSVNGKTRDGGHRVGDLFDIQSEIKVE